MFDAGGSGGAASGATTAPASLGALTGVLERAIDGLLAVDSDGVSDAELAEAMLALRRERLEFTVDGAQRVRKLLQLPASLADLRA